MNDHLKAMHIIVLFLWFVYTCDGLPSVTNNKISSPPQQQKPNKRNTIENTSDNGNNFHIRHSTATPSAINKDVPSRHESKPKLHEHPAWLVYTSAVPTVLIFIICLIIIAIKYRNEDERDLPDSIIDGKPKSKPKKKLKHKINQEVYDAMLAKFKEDKNKKRSFVGRKSSQIRIEGMASRSPKSLARKHIIIGQLAEEDLAPDRNSSALGQLVQLSTHTFIGSSLIEDIEQTNWNSEMKDQAKKDISEQLIMEYDDEKDLLLPEDLEDVFRNFGNWEESLI